MKNTYVLVDEQVMNQLMEINYSLDPMMKVQIVNVLLNTTEQINMKSSFDLDQVNDLRHS